MQTSNTVPFLAALQQVITDPSYMSLTDGDFFFLANNTCQPHHQVAYDSYLLYSMGAEMEIDSAMAELFNQIALMIRDEVLKFKKLVSKEAFEDKPNWRRLTWMLSTREKLLQLEQKQILAAYKSANKAQTEAKPAQDKVAPQQEVAKPVPVKAEVLEPVTVPEVEPATEPAQPQYDLTTPLNVKWQKRFRPDWPWYIEETNTMHLTLAQLREIEAEIAAEKADGINHPNDRFGYIPKGELYDEGFFTFTSNGGMPRLPNCTYRPLIHLKESIRNTIAEQVQLGLVKADGK